jgi:DNA-binding SARP family transcriptional activator
MTPTVTTTATLTVRLLGRLEVELGGAPVRFTGRHAQALIALLALRPRPRLRDAIAADLWPDFEGPSGSSLRQALWLVRSNLVSAGLEPDRVLDVGQETLGIRRDLRVESDAAAFETLATAGPAAVAEAIGLYRGDLVESLGHECFATERERLSDLYEDALAMAAEAALASDDVDAARRYAAILLARDPIREEAHAVLIAAYGRAGSRSQVVRQYRRLCDVLRAELAVPPLPETDAVYREAITRTVERSADRAALLDPAPRLEQRQLRRVLATSA